MSMIRRNNQKYCDIIINGTTRLKDLFISHMMKHKQWHWHHPLLEQLSGLLQVLVYILLLLIIYYYYHDEACRKEKKIARTQQQRIRQAVESNDTGIQFILLSNPSFLNKPELFQSCLSPKKKENYSRNLIKMMVQLLQLQTTTTQLLGIQLQKTVTLFLENCSNSRLVLWYIESTYLCRLLGLQWLQLTKAVSQFKLYVQYCRPSW